MRRALAKVLIPIVALMPVFGQQPANTAQTPPATTPSEAQPGAPTPAGAGNPTAQPPAVQPGTPAVQSLKVVPLAGKDEANDIERHIMAPLVIEVLDQNDRPVEGAEVVFRFPIRGPSATFSDGKTSRTVRTNGQGQAAAMNWTANNETGSFQVHVTATYGNQTGELDVPMSNANRVVEVSNKQTAKHGGWWSPTWVKAAIIGGTAALAAGVFLATRGGGSKSAAAAPTTVTITPGSPTIGGPQ